MPIRNIGGGCCCAGSSSSSSSGSSSSLPSSSSLSSFVPGQSCDVCDPWPNTLFATDSNGTTPLTVPSGGFGPGPWIGEVLVPAGSFTARVCYKLECTSLPTVAVLTRTHYLGLFSPPPACESPGPAGIDGFTLRSYSCTPPFSGIFDVIGPPANTPGGDVVTISP
jgi:hypothetical protein